MYKFDNKIYFCFKFCNFSGNIFKKNKYFSLLTFFRKKFEIKTWFMDLFVNIMFNVFVFFVDMRQKFLLLNRGCNPKIMSYTLAILFGQLLIMVLIYWYDYNYIFLFLSCNFTWTKPAQICQILVLFWRDCFYYVHDRVV